MRAPARTHLNAHEGTCITPAGRQTGRHAPKRRTHAHARTHARTHASTQARTHARTHTSAHRRAKGQLVRGGTYCFVSLCSTILTLAKVPVPDTKQEKTSEQTHYANT